MHKLGLEGNKDCLTIDGDSVSHTLHSPPKGTDTIFYFVVCRQRLVSVHIPPGLFVCLFAYVFLYSNVLRTENIHFTGKVRTFGRF